MQRKKYHVKSGDNVLVISGKWRGVAATISAILKKKDRVVLNLKDLTEQQKQKIGTRTPSRAQRQAGAKGMIERSVSVHVSNVKLVEAEQAK